MNTNKLKKMVGLKTRYLTPAQIEQLNKIAYYKPKLRIGVVVLAMSILLVSILTPFTNLVLIPTALKVWEYR